jgi:hypothetical protein
MLFAMNTELFYQNLTPVEHFREISDPTIYAALPDDWHIAVSDIKNSTDIINQGRYKEVNLIGASAIMAILNIKKSFSVPFIFGGDGACICIPSSMVKQARQALLATQHMAYDLYGIELRVGIVPVTFIREQGYDVRVAAFRISQSFSHAAFNGGGVQFAEECLKNPNVASRFGVEGTDAVPVADYSGLECRWKQVPSVHGEIVTLIVQALSADEEMNSATYRDVIQQIGAIYGEDAKCHPLQEQLLTMTLSEKTLRGESRIRSYAKGPLYRLYYWFKIRYGVLVGKFLMRVNYQTQNFHWGIYKRRLIENTDFKKFDDKLRQVLSGSPQQREQLTAYLEERFQKKELVYGIHTASSALITCLLFNYNDAHVHLVDAENGGYAVAAAQLKERWNTIGVR